MNNSVSCVSSAAAPHSALSQLILRTHGRSCPCLITGVSGLAAALHNPT